MSGDRDDPAVRDPGDPAGRHGRLGPFRHRAFALYLAGGALSSLGTWLQAVAASIYVYQLSGSAFLVGVLGFAAFLPVLLFSVPGGVISDRFDRRNVVIVSSTGAALFAAALSLLAAANLASAPLVMVVAFGLSAASAISKPSLVSLVPDLVPRAEIREAAGLNSIQFVLGQILGPTIAAIVMVTAGAPLAFAVNAATFLGPILVMGYLRRCGLGGRGAARDGVPTDGDAGRAPITVAGGVAHVRAHPWILAALAGVVAGSAPTEVQRTLAPILVAEGLGRPESLAGLIVSAQALGTAIGLIGLVPVRRRLGAERAAAAGLLLQAAGVLIVSQARSMEVAALGVALVGIGFSNSFTIFTGTLQAETPNEMRGRVMAFHQMAHLGNRPITALLVGALAAAVGPQQAMLVALVLAPVGLVAANLAWRGLAAERHARGAHGTMAPA